MDLNIYRVVTLGCIIAIVLAIAVAVWVVSMTLHDQDIRDNYNESDYRKRLNSYDCDFSRSSYLYEHWYLNEHDIYFKQNQRYYDIADEITKACEAKK